MNARYTILLTNIWLADFAGSEVVTRDLSLGLLRRGHRPIVYTPKLGDVAAEISARGVAVIDDLRKLAERPDLIHAHHVIPCGEALIRFPDVPAIQTCHAFDYWAEGPAHFPQIGAYVAVDEACRDRLVHREGIAPERVIVLPNAVDLRRVPARPQPLPERPRRALAFSKAAAVPELKQACDQLGIAYEAIGRAVGTVHPHPEQALVGFDLVFASARAALEALCCGCAVIVCDTRGIAGLVTSRNFDSMRAGNFGLRCLGDAVTVERCVRDAGAYDRADASRVAERARDEADLERLLDRFERLYADLLTGSRRPLIDQTAHEHAAARFLHENLPRRPDDTRWPWLAEREDLQRGHEALEARLLETRGCVARAEHERDQARHDLRRTEHERDQARHDAAHAAAELRDLKRSRLLKVGRLLRRIARRPIPY
jgi:hypothetical protein